MKALRSLSQFACGVVLSAVLAAGMMNLARQADAVGQPPALQGFGLIDAAWLNGLASGLNWTYQFGVTAAGSTRADATQLASGTMLFEVDTAAASTGIALPQCVAPATLMVRNAGAQTVSVYGSATANSTTAANDTINGTAGSTAYTMATNTNGLFFCAKNGAWSAIKGS